MTLKTLKIKARKEVLRAKDLKDLNNVFKRYLGRKGELTRILRSLKNMPKTKRVKIGKQANELKKFLEDKINEKKSAFVPLRGTSADKEEWFDITAPSKKLILGHLHPLTLARRKVEEIFGDMGFTVMEGPEMETEWYNFDALNIPKNHPARDLWDTFYLKNGFLLRTHTSPVQIRFMEKNNPPLRIIALGNVFRHEATDVSHEFQLFQVEGLMVGQKISVANLKATVGEFFQKFFGKEIKIRLTPSFYPFVEPGFDIGCTCMICDGKGCPVCGKSGWLEMAGAGMVHPNVLKNSGLNPEDWQGWAFGFGLERLAMMKYKINDIRLFRSGDLRFLQQF